MLKNSVHVKYVFCGTIAKLIRQKIIINILFLKCRIKLFIYVSAEMSK